MDENETKIEEAILGSLNSYSYDVLQVFSNIWSINDIDLDNVTSMCDSVKRATLLTTEMKVSQTGRWQQEDKQISCVVEALNVRPQLELQNY